MKRKVLALFLVFALLFSFAVPVYAAPAERAAVGADDTITVYFTDALNWGDVKVYYWDNGPEWPGNAMDMVEVNDFNQNVYKATVPADVSGIVFNSGDNQTVDITEGIADNVQWYTLNETEGSNFKVGSTTYAAPDEDVTETSTTAPVETITVYFTDALNWGAANVYYWDNGGEWPGSAMEKAEVNDYGQQVYSADVPADVKGIVFNGNGNQTVDITEDIADGAQWYTVDEKEGDAYKVSLVSEVLPAPIDEPTSAVNPTTGAVRILGDSDGNGEVESIDAAYILRVGAFIKVNIPEDTLMNGDINGDGELDVIDATYIQRYLSYIPTPYPIGEPIDGPVVVPTEPVVEPTEPVVEPTTTEPVETITVKFTDALNWGAANVYYWDNGAEWPGITAMEKAEVNDYGQQVYTAEIPADVKGIIFNGNEVGS